ncbi:MAG: electron transport complex subunit RsxC, partial [Spirochaetaceae bacterium]
APVHSPVSGTIVKIDEVAGFTGYSQPAIQIKTDGDQWLDSIDRSDVLISTIEGTRQELVQKIAEAGIVGLGGAAFPTSVKLSVPAGKTIDSLVINAVECEPYLTADHRVMLEHAREVLVGVRILMRALEVKKAFVGIENNKPDAIAIMKETIANIGAAPEGEISVVGLKTLYPQGAEKQLIKAVLNREVPSGKLPLDVGAVVSNVGTAYAVYRAVQKHQPLVQRVITVTGTGITRPGNFLVRIGTPVEDLIELAGGMPADAGKVIAGGPMMGQTVGILSAPVVKGTSGILVLGKAESRRPEVTPCIRCGRCVNVCPMGLEPYILETLSRAEKNDLNEQMDERRVLDCIECGSCAFTCPAGRPLLDYIRTGKQAVMALRRRTK